MCEGLHLERERERGVLHLESEFFVCAFVNSE